MSQFTIDRLNALARDEQFVYYRGNLEHDIKRSGGIPAYCKLLTRVRDTAASLAETGKVRIEMQPYGKAKWDVFVYRAIGVWDHHRPSCARRTAGQSGFLVVIQSRERPDR